MKTTLSIIYVILCLSNVRVDAALNSTVVMEVEATGNDANGGGYDASSSAGANCSGAIDMSYGSNQQKVTITGTLSLASGTLTDSGAHFAANMCGNIVSVPAQDTGGTVPGYYVITSYTDTKHVGVSVGSHANTSFTNQNAVVGGALASLGGLGGYFADAGVGGQIGYIKKGTYCITDTGGTGGAPRSNIPGGTLLETFLGAVTVIGYNAARGDLDVSNPSTTNAPLFLAASGSGGCNTTALAGTWSFVQNTNASYGGWTFRNLKFDAASMGTVTGFTHTTRSATYSNVSISHTTAGCISAGPLTLEYFRCTGMSGTSAQINPGGIATLHNVEIDSSNGLAAATIVNASSLGVAASNVFIHDINSGASGYGFNVALNGTTGVNYLRGITCANIGSSCINIGLAPAGASEDIQDVLAESGPNTASSVPVAIGNPTNSSVMNNIKNVYWDNETTCSSNCGVGQNLTGVINLVQYCGTGGSCSNKNGSLFVNAAVGDYRLNNTAIGQAIKGLVTTYPSGGGTYYEGVGAAFAGVAQQGGVQ